MLLSTEKGMIHQLSERLTRIEQELGIDPVSELLGVDATRIDYARCSPHQ